MLSNINEDHHGAIAEGPGRTGKTNILRYLCNHQTQWLQNVIGGGVAARLIMPGGTRKSDGAFYSSMGDALYLTAADRPIGSLKKDRIIDFVLNRCGAAGVNLMVLFVDNAQHISLAELDYLCGIDDVIEENGVRLFIAFMRQSDASGIDISAVATAYPSHIVGRFMMGTHRVTGLRGFAEVAHALQRYQHSNFWPVESDISFVANFAPSAVANGYEFESQAPMIMEVVKDIRVAAGLTPENDWPMKTFTSMVKFLLCNVAGRDPAFRSFRPEHIRAALQASGYLQLEYAHAGLLGRNAA
ncbi:hypothetical protein B0E51_06770 [Rhodanobacter sp. C05]|nr:hypothetical protein B0E51_06770 [Rhodanobacter sp. C05]